MANLTNTPKHTHDCDACEYQYTYGDTDWYVCIAIKRVVSRFSSEPSDCVAQDVSDVLDSGSPLVSTDSSGRFLPNVNRAIALAVVQCYVRNRKAVYVTVDKPILRLVTDEDTRPEWEVNLEALMADPKLAKRLRTVNRPAVPTTEKEFFCFVQWLAFRGEPVMKYAIKACK